MSPTPSESNGPTPASQGQQSAAEPTQLRHTHTHAASRPPRTMTAAKMDRDAGDGQPLVQHPSVQLFEAVVEQVREAIRLDVQPSRIVQGSSGSYFCRNPDGQIVGVFKPKNEEPYGHLNPKWTKWLHKTCCLIPNSGYVSEAAASVVDRHLALNIVPRTEIVSLASPSFYYSYLDRSNARRHPGLLPPKIGSFQLFMHNFSDATKFLHEGPQMLRDGRLPRDPVTGGLDHRLQAQFQDQFERLVILDYIIRNTDRGLDNWMVRLGEPDMHDLPDDDGAPRPVGGQFSDPQSESNTSRKRVSDLLPNSAVSNGASQMSGEKEYAVSQQSAESPGPVSSLAFDARTVASNDAVKSVAEFSIRTGAGPQPASGNDLAAANSTSELGHASLFIGSGSMSAPKSKISGGAVMISSPQLHIAAIDNGLAFPFKHPDKWRSYPYGWTSLPAVSVPFSRQTREKYLPILTSRKWWEDLTKDLYSVFSQDPDFDQKLFRRQVAVMKGQVYNLVQVLKSRMPMDGQPDPHAAYSVGVSPASNTNSSSTGRASSATPTSAPLLNREGMTGTPLDLVSQPPCLVWEDDDLKDLIGGHLGKDVVGRDGFLGTVIGLDSVVHSSNNSPRMDDVNYGEPNSPASKQTTSPAQSRPGEAVTIPVPMPGSPGKMGKQPISLDEGEPVGEFLTSPSAVHHSKDKNPPIARRKSRLRDLDVFRGRVITFVKSQPWFSNW